MNIRSWNVSWLAGTPVSFSYHLPGDFSGALFTKYLFNSVNYIKFSNDFPGFGLDLLTRGCGFLSPLLWLWSWFNISDSLCNDGFCVVKIDKKLKN